MLIDWHVHIHDIKDQANPYWKGQCPMTPENVLAAHKLAGLDRTVISNAVHYLRFCKTTKETVTALTQFLAPYRDKESAAPGSGVHAGPAAT